MQFFLYEIVARIVAIYLCVDSSRQLWYGLVERKIAIFNPGAINWILDAFLDESLKVVQRDAAPVRYWIEIAIHITLAVACVVVAIFGWWQPNS
jgi:hypothetical protein